MAQHDLPMILLRFDVAFFVLFHSRKSAVRAALFSLPCPKAFYGFQVKAGYFLHKLNGNPLC